jgi:hypothetical protein
LQKNLKLNQKNNVISKLFFLKFQCNPMQLMIFIFLVVDLGLRCKGLLAQLVGCYDLVYRLLQKQPKPHEKA